jgi:hypothetical protein
MTLRDKVKADVVQLLDIISPLNLLDMALADVEAVKIRETSGFDGSMKRALNVPLSKIARRHDWEHYRIISSVETGELKTIGGAIDLTTAAAEGKPFDGE